VLTELGRRSNVLLVAFPRLVQPDEYVRASEEIEVLLRRLPGIVAVYEAGSVSVPGISDLDRIAVVQGEDPVPAIWSQLSEKSRYLAMHTPFLVDRATFRRHRWFAHVEPLRFAFGRPVELEDPPLPEYTEALMGAESLVICLLRLVKQTSTGRVKVRQFLCELNNVRHGLTLARLGRSEAPAAWGVADDIARLRRAWFTSPESQGPDLIKDVAARAAPALLGALWALGEQTEPGNGTPREMKLGPPLSNVALVSSEIGSSPVRGTPRMHLPLTRGARISEIRWRAARPKVLLHPAVLALLTGRGTPEHREFRLARDELVRGYRKFLATNGLGYSPIGLASPFLAS
jgi:hypothetical protein